MPLLSILGQGRVALSVLAMAGAMSGGCDPGKTAFNQQANASATPAQPAPPPAEAPQATKIRAKALSGAEVRGVTDGEVVFGMVGPMSGPSKGLGMQMKVGIETAFNLVNDAGGVNGRQLRLVAYDDGYEPTRTLPAMKQLYAKDRVFGVIGNVGTPTAAESLPYALEHKILFFGAFTGAGLLRNHPPDRYVFNVRASYAEETAAVARYLVRVRRLRPDQIAVFAQNDSYGDAGYDGATKALRALCGDTAGIVRVGYARNAGDVTEAVARLPAKGLRAVIMVATYRAAAQFIQRVSAIHPGIIFTNVSFVGPTALAEELKLSDRNAGAGIIVTQVVPPIESRSPAVLDYKAALGKYFPGIAADSVSLEGYVTAKVLIEGLLRTGHDLDNERLADQLEKMSNLDLGLGTLLSFGPNEHQASHKVWGTRLVGSGRYEAMELE